MKEKIKMKKLILITCLLLLTVVVNAQQNDFPKLTGPYLGQKPPGRTPEIFAPGIVSLGDSSEYGITFSPDGKEIYFTRSAVNTRIVCARQEEGRWMAPLEWALSSGHSAMLPHVTLDNRRIYWHWWKSTPENPRGGIYVLTRGTAGWTEPVYSGSGMYVSSSRDGRIYLTAPGEQWGLSEATVENGRFIQVKPLKTIQRLGVHSGISPDGDYVLFDNGSGDLKVSFSKPPDDWSDPIQLSRFGLPADAWAGSISPDGKFLFFSRKGDIWWIDAKIIEELRSKE